MTDKLDAVEELKRALAPFVARLEAAEAERDALKEKAGALVAALEIRPIPCSGCGAKTEAERCIGCLHDFGTPRSRRPPNHDPNPACWGRGTGMSEPDEVITAFDFYEAIDPAKKVAKKAAFDDMYDACKRAGWPGLVEGDLTIAYVLRHKISALQSALSAALKRENGLRDALERIEGWLVCYPIASDFDMAESIPEMTKIARTALTGDRG